MTDVDVVAVGPFESPYRLSAAAWSELVGALGVTQKVARGRPRPQAKYSSRRGDDAAETGPAFVWRIALERAGRLGRHLGGGKFAVLCVNDAAHSTPDEDAERAGGSCVLFPPGEGQALGFPKCSHAHCAELTTRDWIEGVGFETWEVALLEVDGWRRAGDWLLTEEGITGWKRVDWRLPGEPEGTEGGPTRIVPDYKNRLSYFHALITADVEEFFEPERSRRYYEIAARVTGLSKTILVPASEYPSLGWVQKDLGADAVVDAGRGKADEFRATLQLLSRPVPRRQVFGFTGMRKVGDQWVYLHAGGALGANGPVEDVEVRIERKEVRRFAFPPIPDDARAVARAVRAAFDLFRFGDPKVMIPLLAATWRAPLGTSPLTLFLAGQQESGKSQMAALAQQHFGPSMHARALPATVKSYTAKSTNALRGIVGDAVFVYDDYLITGNARDDADLASRIDEVTRAQFGGVGRGALQTGGSLVADGAPPRSLLILTGEAAPHLQSIVSRMLTLSVVRRDDDIKPVKERAARGDYALAMAAFIRWLCPQYDAVRAELPDVVSSTAERLTTGRDSRTAELLGECAAGLRKFLEFAPGATEVLGGDGAITRAEVDALREQAWRVFQGLLGDQRGRVTARDPFKRLMGILGSALLMKLCHLTAPDGSAPMDAHRWGWKAKGSRASVGGDADDDGVCSDVEPDMIPGGPCLGWIEPGSTILYTRAEAMLAIARDLANKNNDALPLDAAQLGRGLYDRGLLAADEWKSRKTYTVRRVVSGRQVGGFFAIRAEALTAAEEPAPDKAAVADGGTDSENRRENKRNDEV